MKSITFTCETITPMFLSGADGQTPELRAPSIKGALRFWWRAVNGHLATEENGGIANLLKEDEMLWGGTSTENAGKSSVIVRVIFDNNNADEINIDQIKLENNEGVNYLLYSLIELQKGRLALNSKNEFKLVFSSKSDVSLLKACASFWLFAYFGGIGSRSRRGAGAVFIKSAYGDTYIFKNILNFCPPKTAMVKDFILSNIKEISSKVFQIPKNSTTSDEYSVLNSAPIYVSRVGIEHKKDEFDTWQQALDHIGLILKKERAAIVNKNRLLRKFTMDTLNQKAAFGLPVRVRQDNEVNFKEGYQRRSSPVVISIIQNENGKYNWVVIHLQGKFMPAEASIFFESKNEKLTYFDLNVPTEVPKRKYTFAKENNATLEKFLAKIESQATKIIL
jgi:CRISPR-associated protein Cmr1